MTAAGSCPPNHPEQEQLKMSNHQKDIPEINGRRQSVPRPLAGVRVLDLTRLLPGAYCTQMLADMGAEIIKIEQPGSGDYWRWSDPRIKQQSCQFLALNRGKRSLTLDLKKPEGKEAFLRLCETADVVLEGFRPGVMARLGIDSATIHARNPRVVFCSISGFGQDGPFATLAGHDLNYLGMTGLLNYVNGNTDNPKPTALPVADIGGGALMSIAGILAALVERGNTGKGRTVDVSVTDGLLSWVGFMTARWNVPGQSDVDAPFDEPFNKPFYSIYKTRDGKHMVVGAYERKFWETLCEVLHLHDWVDRQWASGEQEEELRGRIAAAFLTRTQEEWMAIFERHEACVTPVLSVKEAFQSPQAKARNAVISVEDPIEGTLHHVGCPIRFDGVAPNSLAPAPQLGHDSEDLLRDIGYEAGQISALKKSGII
jgi:crotonobetainyl-CoA:carnitine CoA-transferase CaiB-like acyl-CoA transferase